MLPHTDLKAANMYYQYVRFTRRLDRWRVINHVRCMKYCQWAVWNDVIVWRHRIRIRKYRAKIPPEWGALWTNGVCGWVCRSVIIIIWPLNFSTNWWYLLGIFCSPTTFPSMPNTMYSFLISITWKVWRYLNFSIHRNKFLICWEWHSLKSGPNTRNPDLGTWDSRSLEYQV